MKNPRAAINAYLAAARLHEALLLAYWTHDSAPMTAAYHEADAKTQFEALQLAMAALDTETVNPPVVEEMPF